MAEFTPGPWHAFDEPPFLCGGDCRSVDAVTEDGKEVRREICTCLLDTGDEDGENENLDEDVANMRLIAAAPDLYGVLKSVEFGGYDVLNGRICPECEQKEKMGHEKNCQLAAALAKAEGRENQDG